MNTGRDGYARISVEEYTRLSLDIFCSLGFSHEESAIITDVLLQADLFGVESHGISRIMKYVHLVSDGVVDVHAVWRIVHETGISAVIDAESAMGQLVSKTAMEIAIEKAKKNGIGLVQVRNSNHYGIAGYYVRKAVRENLIGICMTNTVAIMAPTFSAEALLGSNPIAFGFPGGYPPFIFDASTTVVTRGKIELYNKLGKRLPYEWAVDRDGTVCYDPGTVLESITQKQGGGILPLGGAGEELSGYKGYGLAYICELLTSVLSGGVNSIHKTDRGDTSHAFYAIDPTLFGEPDEIIKLADELAREIRSSRPAQGCERIFTAGEKEYEQEIYNRTNGVPVSRQSVEELNKIAEKIGVKGIGIN